MAFLGFSGVMGMAFVGCISLLEIMLDPAFALKSALAVKIEGLY